MNIYYHSIPQCPDCGSPLNGSGRALLKGRHCYICTGDGGGCHIFRRILPWRIKFNELEISYIDWLVNSRPKRILAVTWPFINPEIFSTVLAYEYLQRTGENAMVVTHDGHTLEGTSLAPFKVPECLYIQGDKNESTVNEIDLRDVFPAVRAYHYSLRELSIHGMVHADTIRGFHNRMADLYGEELAAGARIQNISNSRFGRLKSYTRSDFKCFHSHMEIKMSTVVKNNIIFHGYTNVQRLVNYINKYNPDLIIFIDVAHPFINGDEFYQLKTTIHDRTVLLLGTFNQDEIMGIARNIGTENVATLNTFEFMDLLDDRTDMYPYRSCRIPKINVEPYRTAMNIKINDKNLQDKLDKILGIARITLRPLNLIGTDSGNYGIDDILNDLSKTDVEDYESLKKRLSDTNVNPWALEIARYIMENGLDSADNCIVTFHDSAVTYVFHELGISRIKIVTPHNLLKYHYHTVIMTYLPKSFNPSMVNADMILYFACDGYSGYIKYFYKNKKYLQYENYFIFNDMNMPQGAADIMRKINNDVDMHIDLNYSYIPGMRDFDDADQHNNKPPAYKIKSGEGALLLYDNSGNYVAVPEGVDVYVIKSGRLVELNTGDRDATVKITGSLMPLDKSGFYASVKARIIYFLLHNSDRIRINGMDFTEVYKISRIWIDKLAEMSESAPDIAAELSGLGITARNQYYISTWWRIIETYGCVQVYRIERPKSPDDMIKIFNYLYKKTGDANFLPDMAVKCYGACVGIQHARNALLHDRYPHLNEKFSELISSMVMEGKSFQVSQARFVTLDRDINAMEIHGETGDSNAF